MSLLTTYDEQNKVIIQGKTRRITSSPIGDPVTTIEKTTGGEYTVQSQQWYKVTQLAMARYQYVGMDLNTAKQCAEAMRTKFTRQKLIWSFKLWVDDNHQYAYEWKSEAQGTVLDTEISLDNQGGGMYSVTVNCNCVDEHFTTTPASYTPPWPSCMSDVD